MNIEEFDGVKYPESRMQAGYQAIHNNQIIQACSHFRDMTDLDRYAYVVTIDVQDGRLDQVKKSIYHKLCKLFLGKAFPTSQIDLPNRPAFILNDDIAGTRFNDFEHTNNHLHCILILPKTITDEAGFFIAHCVKQIGEFLSKIDEVRGVHVDSYDYSEPLSYVLGYCNKLSENKSSREHASAYVGSTVFPYEWDMEKSRKVEQRVEARFNDRLDAYLVAPHLFYSDKYNELYHADIVQNAKLIH